MQKSEFEVMGQTIIQSFDGKDAWWVNPFMGATNPQIMPDDIAQSVKGNVFESQLLNYLEKGNSIDLIGKDSVEKKLTYKIKLTRSNEEIEYYYFDENSFNLILMQGTLSSGS